MVQGLDIQRLESGRIVVHIRIPKITFLFLPPVCSCLLFHKRWRWGYHTILRVFHCMEVSKLSKHRDCKFDMIC